MAEVAVKENQAGFTNLSDFRNVGLKQNFTIFGKRCKRLILSNLLHKAIECDIIIGSKKASEPKPACREINRLF
ncbi:hypothetical protein [Haemophilus parahaemolyticus]